MSRHSNNWANLTYHTNTQAHLLREYEAQVARIERTVKSAEARGYSVNRERLGLSVPSVLRQASVSRLKNITSKDIYGASKYTTPGGKVVSGTKGRKMERSAAARKGAQTKIRKKERKKTAKEKYGRDRTPHTRNDEDYSPSSFYEGYIEEFLDRAYDCACSRNHGAGEFDIYDFWCDFIANVIGEYGEDEVGQALSEAAEAGYLEREIFYDWNLTLDAQIRVAEILYDNGIMSRKEFDEFNEAISNIPSEDSASIAAIQEAADEMMAQW